MGGVFLDTTEIETDNRSSRVMTDRQRRALPLFGLSQHGVHVLSVLSVIGPVHTFSQLPLLTVCCPPLQQQQQTNKPTVVYGVLPKGLLTFLGRLYKKVAKTISGTLVYRVERQTARKKILRQTPCPRLRM